MLSASGRASALNFQVQTLNRGDFLQGRGSQHHTCATISPPALKASGTFGQGDCYLNKVP